METNMRTGRKRKANVIRDSAGRSRGETEDSIRSVALAYRARELAEAGLGHYFANKVHRRRGERGSGHSLADPLNGSTLGLLRQRNKASRGDPSGINQAQFDAGEKWAGLCRRHAQIMGYPIGTTRSTPLELIGGRSCVPDADDDVALDIRRRWSDCYRALMDAGVSLRRGVHVALICWEVCVNNRNIRHMGAQDFGDLRAGLNALARVMRYSG
jgi:hypothetical protein